MPAAVVSPERELHVGAAQRALMLPILMIWMFPYPDRSLRLLTERCQEHRLKGVP